MAHDPVAVRFTDQYYQELHREFPLWCGDWPEPHVIEALQTSCDWLARAAIDEVRQEQSLWGDVGWSGFNNEDVMVGQTEAGDLIVIDGGRDPTTVELPAVVDHLLRAINAVTTRRREIPDDRTDPRAAYDPADVIRAGLEEFLRRPAEVGLSVNGLVNATAVPQTTDPKRLTAPIRTRLEKFLRRPPGAGVSIDGLAHISSVARFVANCAAREKDSTRKKGREKAARRTLRKARAYWRKIGREITGDATEQSTSDAERIAAYWQDIGETIGVFPPSRRGGRAHTIPDELLKQLFDQTRLLVEEVRGFRARSQDQQWIRELLARKPLVAGLVIFPRKSGHPVRSLSD